MRDAGPVLGVSLCGDLSYTRCEAHSYLAVVGSGVKWNRGEKSRARAESGRPSKRSGNCGMTNGWAGSAAQTQPTKDDSA